MSAMPDSFFKARYERTCPHCQKKYILGINGVKDGCDECLAVVRNPIDNTIVNMDFSKAFAEDEQS